MSTAEQPNTAGFQRAFFTFVLNVCGCFNIAIAVIGTSLLIIVPIFGLENENWKRTDNPVTPGNVLLTALIGIGCLWLAKQSNRVRLGGFVCLFVLGIIYGVITEIVGWDHLNPFG